MIHLTHDGSITTLALPNQLFKTNVDPEQLWQAYLNGFPADQRQYYTCSCCRKFIKSYGNLAMVDEHGGLFSAMFHGDATDTPDEYRRSFRLMQSLIANAKIKRPFYSKNAVLGDPVKGDFGHLSAQLVGEHLLVSTVTAYEKAAAKVEAFKTLQLALDEWPEALVKRAVTLLEHGTMYRSEKVQGATKFLLTLHGLRKQPNSFWKAVAEAPEGFCHPRSSMVGTFLNDLKAGKTEQQAMGQFAQKMDPLAYQRPQAPPKDGAIERAEKLFAEMGLAPALDRRLATLEDLPVRLWVSKDTVEKAEGKGLFGHLRKQPAPPEDLPTKTMTWEKFREKVLGDVLQIQVNLDHAGNQAIWLTTAQDPDAPPILQWDSQELRNPVAWYCRPYGAAPHSLGLSPGWADVSAITPMPPHFYGDKFKHMDERAILLLKGAVAETRRHHGGLFPEQLRSELHEVRSVIEADANLCKATTVEEPAIGIQVQSVSPNPVNVRVLTADGWACYTIDRWE